MVQSSNNIRNKAYERLNDYQNGGDEDLKALFLRNKLSQRRK